jgi:hypothetical protein
MLRRVVSGGQVGADVAGLNAAWGLGIETGGFMPRGFRTRAGPRPEYAQKFGCRETGDWRYPERTMRNVRNSDATLRLARSFDTAGERLTKKYCDLYARPCYSVDWTPEQGFAVSPSQVAEWLKDVEVLNVAGNALAELEQPAEGFLHEVFCLLLGKEPA